MRSRGARVSGNVALDRNTLWCLPPALAIFKDMPHNERPGSAFNWKHDPAARNFCQLFEYIMRHAKGFARNPNLAAFQLCGNSRQRQLIVGICEKHLASPHLPSMGGWHPCSCLCCICVAIDHAMAELATEGRLLRSFGVRHSNSAV